MGTRELLILILGLAVIAVILRGLYVAIQARRNQIRLAIDRNIPQDIDLEELEMSELPSGGARVVKRSLEKVNLQNSLQSELDLGVHGDAEESVPMLMDSVELRTGTSGQRDKSAPVAKDADQSKADRARAVFEEETDEDSFDPWELPGSRSAEAELDSIEMDEEDGRQLAAAQYDQPEADEDGRYDSAGWEDEPDPADWSGEAESEPESESEDPSDIFSEYEEGRQEPNMGLDEELGDEFAEFSMSAGDRIGAPETDPAADGQSDTDNTSADTGRGEKKASLFSRFGRKEERSYQDQDHADLDFDEGEDMDDPLFSSASVKKAETESRTAGSRESEASLRRTADLDNARAEAAVRSEPVAEEPARQSGRDTAGKAGVADFNQARESRRPASGSRRGNGHSVEASGSRNDFEPSEVLVVNVMSREDEMFHGADLLQVLTTAGLKHGDMNIFHKHLGRSADSPIVFSVANILNPGTFELEKMEQFETRGVSLFLAMPAVISNREAFDDMLRIAQQIRAALDGELRDDRRSVMTAQTIEHYRQRIQDYELRKLKAAQVHS